MICTWDINVTNEEGILMLGDNKENASERRAHTDTKTYTYTKGYCGGHPEPEIEESGDPEIDTENETAAKGSMAGGGGLLRASCRTGRLFFIPLMQEKQKNSWRQTGISSTVSYITEIRLLSSRTDSAPGLYKSWKSYRRYSDRGKNCHVFRVQRPSGIQGRENRKILSK